MGGWPSTKSCRKAQVFNLRRKRPIQSEISCPKNPNETPSTISSIPPTPDTNFPLSESCPNTFLFQPLSLIAQLERRIRRIDTIDVFKKKSRRKSFLGENFENYTIENHFSYWQWKWNGILYYVSTCVHAWTIQFVKGHELQTNETRLTIWAMFITRRAEWMNELLFGC